MADAITSITSRIEWCRRQKTQARTPLEHAGWHAEEEGLLDALLNRNHTYQYQHGPPDVFARYVMGLLYGREVLRTALAYHQLAPPTRTGTTGNHEGSYGTDDASTRCMLGRTRRGEQ